jgi:hypothetical protein
LIAELIGGEIARLLGLKVPELVFANLDEAFGRSEADEEIQDLLKFSVGLTLRCIIYRAPLLMTRWLILDANWHLK